MRPVTYRISIEAHGWWDGIETGQTVDCRLAHRYRIERALGAGGEANTAEAAKRRNDGRVGQ